MPDVGMDVATLQWAYLGLLGAFTICLALISQFTASSGLRWWLASNIATLGAFALSTWRGPMIDRDLVYLVPSLLLVIAAALKLVAVSNGATRRTLGMVLVLTVSTFALGYKLLDSAGLIAVRVALTMGVLGVLTGLIAQRVHRNRRWQGLGGRDLLTIAFATASFALLASAVLALVGQGDYEYFSQGDRQSLNFGLNLLQLIIIHTGYIAVVIGRQYRVTARVESRRAALIRFRREAEAVARERQSLLQILTHEVRQPLNNALAALQEITRAIPPAKFASSGLAEPLGRLHHTIDHIVLSLSNAIVGASLLERRAEQTLTLVDISAIAELACGDCSAQGQTRIHLTGAEHARFVQGDPVLLRLAFRNLLDNAVKFSPPGSAVEATIRIDEDRLGIVFEVTNTPIAPFKPDAALFERATRGNTRVEGDGLGLFIVREVARIHAGVAEAKSLRGGRVRFGLLIPA